MIGEFDIIERFFKRQPKRSDVVMGIGDDAALVTPPENCHLVVTCDTLVEGVHFFPDMPANALGYKALAVSLSDLAAMGAEPRWVSLAITLPCADTTWLSSFCEGFFELAEYFNVTLIGGDTTRGPLSVTVTAHGVLPHDRALLRGGAKAGDSVYVTGNLGASGLALLQLQGELKLPDSEFELVLNRHYYPQPRVLTGYGLRDVANSCIDISDGLMADLGHLLVSSGCGAQLELDNLPINESVMTALSKPQAMQLALTAGEDYELCFTVPPVNKGALDVALSHCGISFTCIGQLNTQAGQIQMKLDGEPFVVQQSGWDHFSSLST